MTDPKKFAEASSIAKQIDDEFEILVNNYDRAELNTLIEKLTRLQATGIEPATLYNPAE